MKPLQANCAKIRPVYAELVLVKYLQLVFGLIHAQLRVDLSEHAPVENETVHGFVSNVCGIRDSQRCSGRFFNSAISLNS